MFDRLHCEGLHVCAFEKILQDRVQLPTADSAVLRSEAHQMHAHLALAGQHGAKVVGVAQNERGSKGVHRPARVGSERHRGQQSHTQQGDFQNEFRHESRIMGWKTGCQTWAKKKAPPGR